MELSRSPDTLAEGRETEAGAIPPRRLNGFSRRMKFANIYVLLMGSAMKSRMEC